MVVNLQDLKEVTRQEFADLPKVFQSKKDEKQIQCAGKYSRYGKKGDP